MFDIDHTLIHWLSTHHGVISLEEAAAIGVDHDALERRATAGVLTRPHPGVYRHLAHPPTFLASLRAAALAVGPGGYISGPSLMRLHDVRGRWADEPELTLVGVDHKPVPGIRLRRIDRLHPVDAVELAGLPSLSPELGLLLLGDSVHGPKVETAVHDMVFQGRTDRTKLLGALVRYAARGRRGTTAFRVAVRSLDPKGKATQTNLELQLLRAVRAHGVPEPRLQHPVVDGDGRRRRLDLAWPEQKLDVETDGDRWHLNPRDRAEMKKRDLALEAVGYEVMRFGTLDVVEGTVAAVARIMKFFGATAAHRAA